ASVVVSADLCVARARRRSIRNPRPYPRAACRRARPRRVGPTQAGGSAALPGVPAARGRLRADVLSHRRPAAVLRRAARLRCEARSRLGDVSRSFGVPARTCVGNRSRPRDGAGRVLAGVAPAVGTRGPAIAGFAYAGGPSGSELLPHLLVLSKSRHP